MADEALPGTVANDQDIEAQRAMIARSRRFGLMGGGCIHLAIVPSLNEGFQPTGTALRTAAQIVTPFAEAERAGRASVQVDGKMTDIHVVERAKRLLAFAARVQAKDARSARMEVEATV